MTQHPCLTEAKDSVTVGKGFIQVSRDGSHQGFFGFHTPGANARSIKPTEQNGWADIVWRNEYVQF
jgi:hypothetical protein